MNRCILGLAGSGKTTELINQIKQDGHNFTDVKIFTKSNELVEKWKDKFIYEAFPEQKIEPEFVNNLVVNFEAFPRRALGLKKESWYPTPPPHDRLYDLYRKSETMKNFRFSSPNEEQRVADYIIRRNLQKGPNKYDYLDAGLELLKRAKVDGSVKWNHIKAVYWDEGNDGSYHYMTLLKTIFTKADLVVAADFFQNIFYWAGSESEVLMDFINDPTVVKIIKNLIYRYPQEILDEVLIPLKMLDTEENIKKIVGDIKTAPTYSGVVEKIPTIEDFDFTKPGSVGITAYHNKVLLEKIIPYLKRIDIGFTYLGAKKETFGLNSDKIIVGTTFKLKGQEYDRFVILNDLPKQAKFRTKEDYCELLRVMYVQRSRARKELYYIRKSSTYGVEDIFEEFSL